MNRALALDIVADMLAMRDHAAMASRLETVVNNHVGLERDRCKRVAAYGIERAERDWREQLAQDAAGRMASEILEAICKG